MKKSIFQACILLLHWGVCSCFNPEVYDQLPEPDKNIWFVSENVKDVLADGRSSGTIKVEITREASVGRRTVVFKANSGAFVGGAGDSIEVEVSEDFIASAQLTNLRAVKSTVIAKIRGIKAAGGRDIEFVKAFPNGISVRVDSFSVASDYKGEVTIDADLVAANNGKPSIGHEVRFGVVNAVTKEDIGDFLNDQLISRTDEHGRASIRFSPGVLKFKGYATITATTNVSEKETKSNQTRIYIR